MPGDSAKTRLLQELRIDRESGVEASSLWHGWRLAAVIALLCRSAAAVAAFMLLRAPRFEVEAPVAVAPSTGSGSAAILQATGYVTARREATVSAQITGALTAVLIEEGEHVTAGQILAQLDNSAQKASWSQAQAQGMAARALLVQFQGQIRAAGGANTRE